MNQQALPANWRRHPFQAMGCQMSVWLQMEDAQPAGCLMRKAEAMFRSAEGVLSPFWFGLGIIGMYLMVLTTLTFYIRHRIGYRTFHAIHFMTYGAFVLALLHSWFAGTDTPAMEIIYISTGLIVFFLVIYRLLVALSPRRHTVAQQV
jgi:DMSO/TMAO reductase YedYZ heme-binding membrane subunit